MMDSAARLLVIDDEEPFRRLLDRELTRKGFIVAVAGEGREALALLRDQVFDAVLLDVMMPGMDGISLMKELRNDPSTPPVIVITGQATVETAVAAMKHGAYDYLTKPYKLDELEIIINRAVEFGKLLFKNTLLEQELVRKESSTTLIGKSDGLRNVLALVGKVAPTDSTVLIEGESGTGKELVANAIWGASQRNGRPFLALNCATLSENLMESELFGHEKGAFTAAYQKKYGIVEVADGGTLFLDEIGEIPLEIQAKLLRFLDSGEFRRVGGTKNLRVDVRVIAATNKDLRARVAAGQFREDLYYRLNVITVRIPPLRERKDDIADLAGHFAERYSRKLAKSICGFSDESLEKLTGYDWPGNVRELENVVERAVVLCEGGSVQPEDLSLPDQGAREAGKAPDMLDDVEREHILGVLRKTGGNRTQAAAALGIDRKTLYRKLKRFEIEWGPR